MEKQFELISFDKDSPFHLTYLNLGEIQGHWHSELEILFVLIGKIAVVVNDRRYILNEEDIIVINKNTIHSLSSQEGCIALSLKLNTQIIPDDSIYFDCNSSLDSNKGNYYTLKHLIAKLVKVNSANNPDEINKNKYQNLSIFYSILSELTDNFKSTAEQSVQSKKYLTRLTSIIDYIDNHYKEAITLQQLADVVNLSVPYLSSFFEKYLGVNFLTYYNEIRLDRAVNELLASDESVESIAANNGFTDSRSFVTLFKKKYNTLPSIYRKQSGKIKNTPSRFYDGKSFDNEGHLSVLAKYLSKNVNQNSTELSRPQNLHFESDLKILNKEKIDISKTGTKLKHTFKKLISISRAKELLLAENQEMLRQVQSEIGYEYIKFHGLLADDMLVYKEDKDGNPIYSFVYIDKVIDFIRSIGFKPVINFAFTPSDLASDKNRNVYASPFNISLPKDMNKWTKLVSTLTSHLIDRYSLTNVKEWLFTVWNEPNTTEYIFGFKNDNDFYSLYLSTFTTIKNISADLQFGSPPLLLSYKYCQDWAVRFIEWCSENKCLPDYMNVNYYDNDFNLETISSHTPAHPAHSRLNKDENAFQKCIHLIKNLFDNNGIGNLPIYLTEWNLTVSHRNLLNDTCFKSCYLAKNLLENYDALDSFGYWVLTDLNEEIQISPEEFHGGLGLFTINGIKKPHYHMFRQLSKLGDELVERGEGYFITKSELKIQIVLYNYEHFNHLFAQGEAYDMTFTERYTPFSNQGRMEVSLELIGLNASRCKIKEEIINQTSGSAFDEWIKMGAISPDKQGIEYLKHISIPHIFQRISDISDNSLQINVLMAPLEVRFIEIELL